MIPQTRNYVDRRLIFEKFEDMFEDYDDFTRIYDVNCWKSIGAEFFSKKWFVPGAFFSTHRYQLKDAMSLLGFALSDSNSLATRSAILYHFNFGE
jgi:hypothetical protein